MRCKNFLKILGQEEKLLEFNRKFLVGHITKYSFNNFIQGPFEVHPEDLREWRLKNWGTAYNCSDVFKMKHVEDLTFHFYTHRNHCMPVVLKMSEAFPELTFEYIYDGTGAEIAGSITVKDSVITQKKHFDSKNLMGLRRFKQETFADNYETCSNCGALLEECEYEEECVVCGLTLEEREREIILKETFEKRLEKNKGRKNERI